MKLHVQIIFKNGQKILGMVSEMSEVEGLVKKYGYGIDMIRSIQFGGN